MNNIEALEKLLQSRYPQARIKIDRPLDLVQGVWDLDVKLGECWLNLERYASKGSGYQWGLSWWVPGLPEWGYGDGPDNVYMELPLERIVEMLDSVL